MKSYKLAPVCSRYLGFTLIEVLIVVVMVGVVTAMAVPAYSSYSGAARQAGAMVGLNRIALSLERYYQENRSYDTDMHNLNVPDSDKWYRYSIQNADRFSYDIRADPVAQNSSLSSLSLNQVGKKMHQNSISVSWIPGWP